jgi:DNA mismatch repair ATPase MutL
MSNSFDASASKVAVTFGMDAIGGIDFITVEDDGGGMLPEARWVTW